MGELGLEGGRKGFFGQHRMAADATRCFSESFASWTTLAIIEDADADAAQSRRRASTSHDG